MKPHKVEQNTPEWFELRKGKPTASAASRIVTSTGKLSKSIELYAQELAIETIKSVLDNPFKGNKWTDLGHELEGEAAAQYDWLYDVETYEAGFITDDDGTIGASMDRLVGDNGAVEIKCFTDVKHLENCEAYNKDQKFPTGRMAQAQFQLLVSEREFVDLFFYHRDLKPLRIRTEPITEFQDALKEGIAQLLKRRDEIIDAQR